MATRRDAGSRRYIWIGAAIALVTAAVMVPWLYAPLSPPWSESPAGLLLVLGKAMVILLLSLGAVGALLGTLFVALQGDSEASR